MTKCLMTGRDAAGKAFYLCSVSKVRIDKSKCLDCKTAVADSPEPKEIAHRTIVQRMVKYSVAVTRWVAAGMPTREESEVNFIYDTHCAGCAVFDSCPLCGCKVNKSKIAFLNKIKMETEHCPEGKW